MKKIGITIISALTMAIIATGCGKSEDSSANERNELLNEANSNAKLVYTTATNELADLEVMGTVSSTTSGTYSYNISDTDMSDPIQEAVYNALSDKENGSIYISIVNCEVKFAQWSSDSLSDLTSKGSKWVTTDNKIIGQYPDPTEDISDEYIWGEKNTPGSKNDDNTNLSTDEQSIVDALKAKFPGQYISVVRGCHYSGYWNLVIDGTGEGQCYILMDGMLVPGISDSYDPTIWDMMDGNSDQVLNSASIQKINSALL